MRRQQDVGLRGCVQRAAGEGVLLESGGRWRGVEGGWGREGAILLGSLVLHFRIPSGCMSTDVVRVHLLLGPQFYPSLAEEGSHLLKVG